MNRLFQHSTILLFALCSALVSPFIPVPAAAEQPDVAQQHYERGAALLRKGDLAAASEAARKAIELNLSSAEARHLLGMIYFKEKKTAQALDAFNQRNIRGRESLLNFAEYEWGDLKSCDPTSVPRRR